MSRANAAGTESHRATVARLSLYGPARLDVGGRTVRLQRKGLALLYVLALDGPTRRERMADLLWGHGQALRNLRVELHGLRKALAAYGIAAFDRAEDPLVLPPTIRIDRTERPGEALEGLEDLSGEFHAWLEGHRTVLQASDGDAPVFTEVVAALADEVRVPYVLILEGLPFAGRVDLARTLAARMDLPFREGTDASGRGLRYVAEGTTFTRELVDRIAADRMGLWVIERPAFGEDPFLVLALRDAVPAERLQYLRVGPLGWHELRTQRLAPLPFAEAAQVYLASGGLVGYVDELLAIRPEDGFGGYVPVPRRVRAGFQMEARRLSMEARFALGRLSVHPGAVPEPLLDALEVGDHLPELERRRWVRFDGTWSFVDDAARTLAYEDLQPGQRLLTHRRAAEVLAASGQAGPARYHRWCADGRDRTADPFESLREPVPPPYVRVRVEEPFRSAEPIGMAGDVEWVEERVWIPAAPTGVRLARVGFDLPRRPCVVRLSGRVERSAPLVSNGRPTAIELSAGAPNLPALRLVAGRHHGFARDGTFELALGREIDLRLWIPAGGRLSLGTSTAGLVANLAVETAPAATDADPLPADAAGARDASGGDDDLALAWSSLPSGVAHDRPRDLTPTGGVN